VTLAWLVGVPLVFIFLAAGFIREGLLGIRRRRGENSDGTDSPPDEILRRHSRMSEVGRTDALDMPVAKA
jgi:hypothetical protein